VTVLIFESFSLQDCRSFDIQQGLAVGECLYTFYWKRWVTISHRIETPTTGESAAPNLQYMDNGHELIHLAKSSLFFQSKESSSPISKKKTIIDPCMNYMALCALVTMLVCFTVELLTLDRPLSIAMTTELTNTF
jgi:hypothetical protein